MRVRVRYGQRELKRISRTATLGGLFLSFLKIGLVGFGGGLAVIAQIRTLTVRKRHWLNEVEFAEGFALAQSLPGTAAGNVATTHHWLTHQEFADATALGQITPGPVLISATLKHQRHRKS